MIENIETSFLMRSLLRESRDAVTSTRNDFGHDGVVLLRELHGINEVESGAAFLDMALDKSAAPTKSTKQANVVAGDHTRDSGKPHSSLLEGAFIFQQFVANNAAPLPSSCSVGSDIAGSA